MFIFKLKKNIHHPHDQTCGCKLDMISTLIPLFTTKEGSNYEFFQHEDKNYLSKSTDTYLFWYNRNCAKYRKCLRYHNKWYDLHFLSHSVVNNLSILRIWTKRHDPVFLPGILAIGGYCTEHLAGLFRATAFCIQKKTFLPKCINHSCKICGSKESFLLVYAFQDLCSGWWWTISWKR